MKQRLTMLLWPTLGLKRWLAVFAVGLVAFGLGTGFAMGIPISPKVLPLMRTLTLSGFPILVRGGFFLLLGSGMVALALLQIYRLFASGAALGRSGIDLLTALDQDRRQRRGPKIVALGGGTGMGTLLRGLKLHTGNLTAIVTIADDGGSSGRLRTDLGIPPLGDARSCLVALSESETLLEDLFNYRFPGHSALGGHSLGNLLLAALYDMRGGFPEALHAAAQLLVLQGQVVPASTHTNVGLVGETVSGRTLRGESVIGQAPDQLRRVWIEPEAAPASEAALEAIREAELIVIGPGSLYTSIIPNFLHPGIREAVNASRAPKVFVCNVATQPHETDGYTASDHLQAFQEHSDVGVTHVLLNSNVISLPSQWNQSAVAPGSGLDGFPGALVPADVVDQSFRTRHDSQKLARILLSISRNPSRRETAPTAAGG